MVRMHRSQRTGAATWATMRSSHSLPVVTAAPSASDSEVRERAEPVLGAEAFLALEPLSGAADQEARLVQQVERAPQGCAVEVGRR